MRNEKRIEAGKSYKVEVIFQFERDYDFTIDEEIQETIENFNQNGIEMGRAEALDYLKEEIKQKTNIENVTEGDDFPYDTIEDNNADLHQWIKEIQITDNLDCCYVCCYDIEILENATEKNCKEIQTALEGFQKYNNCKIK